MTDTELKGPGGELSPELIKQAMKAFKKRLKLTALDEDSRLGRSPCSAGKQGVCAIQPPNQYPPAVWEELCRQGRLRHSGHGLYELRQPDQKE